MANFRVCSSQISPNACGLFDVIFLIINGGHLDDPLAKSAHPQNSQATPMASFFLRLRAPKPA